MKGDETQDTIDACTAVHERSRGAEPAERADRCRTGRADTDQNMKTLLGWTKELGCNFVRLAHGSHDERVTWSADCTEIRISY
jgi:hypothetical protein